MSAERAVPLLDLTAQYARIKTEIDAAVERVLMAQRFVMGPEVSRFEDEIAGYCDVAHAISCGSGSDALLLALTALEVGPGDEVICPAYTFFATAGSIALLGARPVFVDIDPATFNLDPQQARDAAKSCRRLRALVPVDLFGQTCDVDAFLDIGRDFDVPVIEDAAQAIGARDARGARAGSRATVGCFSFFPSKNLGAYGDGGLVVTQDLELASRIATLRLHGASPKYFHSLVGMNSRLDALQAAILRVKLRYLDAWTKERQENASRYDASFAAAGASVRTPACPPAPATHIYNQYAIRVPAERRDELRSFLQQRRISTEIYYPRGLHMQECFGHLGYHEGDLPETERAARETVALPAYPELDDEQLDRVTSSVAEFLGRD